jgi:phosphoribosylglycinamide formyltransferase-1
MKRIAVLASGRGSNFQALIDAVHEGRIPGRLIALLTDNPDAYAVVRAKDAGIPVKIIDYKAHSSRAGYETALRDTMRQSDADLFVLAGYMRILDPGTVQGFRGRIINIHPALLPSFPGLHAQRQALAHGVKVAGCTVHFVDEETDHGPIILQTCVPVLEDDDDETLAERILLEEHHCLPEAVRLFCEGKIRIHGRRVQIC